MFKSLFYGLTTPFSSHVHLLVFASSMHGQNFTSKHIKNEWWLLKHIDIIVMSWQTKESVPYPWFIIYGLKYNVMNNYVYLEITFTSWRDSFSNYNASNQMQTNVPKKPLSWLIFNLFSNWLESIISSTWWFKTTPNCCHHSFYGCHGHILPHSTIFINCTSSHNLNSFTILIHLWISLLLCLFLFHMFN